MPVEFEGVQELLRTFGLRVGEESLGIIGLFHDATVFKQDDLVGDSPRELHLMRDDEHGLAAIGELEHHVEHLTHHFRVKRGGDLVEQQHFRMQNQRSADGHTLTLTAGKLMWPGILAISQSDTFQQCDGLLFDLGFVALLHEGRRKRDVAEYGFVRKQVIALKHHADTRAQLTAALAATCGFGARPAGFDDLAIERYGTALDRLESRDGAQQRRLAGTGRSDDHEHLAVRYLEGNIVQHRPVGVGVLLDQMRDLKAWLLHVSHATTSFPVGGPRWTAASTR